MSRRKPRFTPDPPPYGASNEQILAWVNAQLQRIEDYWPRDDGDRITALEELQGALTGEWSISGQSNIRFEGYTSETVTPECAIDTLTFTASYTPTVVNGPAFAVSEDGLTMFIHRAASERIYQYSMSSANDPSTLVSTGNSLDMTAWTNSARNFAVSPSGHRIYVPADGSGTPRYRIQEYALSTPWDITTAVATSTGCEWDNAGIFVGGTGVSGCGLTPDGKQLFLSNSNTTNVAVWELDDAFDIATAAYKSTISMTSLPSGVTNWVFDPAGKTLFALNGGGSGQKYTLSTANDVTTQSYVGAINYTGASNANDMHFESLRCSTLMVLITPSGNTQFRRYSVNL